jgi:methylthioxylose transferase
VPKALTVERPVAADHRVDRACRWGFGTAVVLIAAAMLTPPVTGWAVHATGSLPHTVGPLHAQFRPIVGVGTPFALAIGYAGVRYGPALAERLSWRRLLMATYAGGLAWNLALAFVYGPGGLSRAMASPDEYLYSAHRVQSVHTLLETYVDRIPFSAGAAHWPIHPAGHPPGALLFFVALIHVGLGAAFTVGLVISLIGVSAPVAVLVTLRRLGAESAARRTAPFLVLTPAAVWVTVTADSMFSAVGAWGVTAMAVAATTGRTEVRWGAAALAGLLLGMLPALSYGLVLYATLPLAVLVLTRAWRLLPAVAALAVLPVLALAAGGFVWWEAYPVLRERYWDGLARLRPASYWLWADLASLALCAGPALGAGLAALVARGRDGPRAVRYLVGAAALSIAAADASLMSKGEVERIWLPFVPWLLTSTSLLPDRWRRPALAVQVVVALLLEHLLDTVW